MKRKCIPPPPPSPQEGCSELVSSQLASAPRAHSRRRSERVQDSEARVLLLQGSAAWQGDLAAVTTARSPGSLGEGLSGPEGALN